MHCDRTRWPSVDPFVRPRVGPGDRHRRKRAYGRRARTKATMLPSGVSLARTSGFGGRTRVPKPDLVVQPAQGKRLAVWRVTHYYYIVDLTQIVGQKLITRSRIDDREAILLVSPDREFLAGRIEVGSTALPQSHDTMRFCGVFRGTRDQVSDPPFESLAVLRRVTFVERNRVEQDNRDPLAVATTDGQPQCVWRMIQRERSIPGRDQSHHLVAASETTPRGARRSQGSLEVGEFGCGNAGGPAVIEQISQLLQPFVLQLPRDLGGVLVFRRRERVDRLCDVPASDRSESGGAAAIADSDTAIAVPIEEER